ncbi:unnamed protein product [Oikopleura dioica]|uniref:Uncharacterized protein n=1 Tax=Oikopleura dioica TaxID=34765 RepID=E4YI78_OIKDI|nr:unnamed protein product [Oikopleura dioica]
MDFAEIYEILVKVPKDAGSLSEPFLFYYGSQQFLMHVRACSSRAINLQCTHARSKGTMCKAVTKIIVLYPKMIKSEKRLEAKRERTIFKLDHDFLDIKDLSKYGTVTTIKPHTCQPSPNLFGVTRWKRQSGTDINQQEASVAFSEIEEDNEDFWWFIETQ